MNMAKLEPENVIDATAMKMAKSNELKINVCFFD